MISGQAGAIAEADLYRAIVELGPDAVICSDRDGMIQAWNRGAEAVFGYSPEEVLGRSLDVIIPEQLRDAHWNGFRKAIATGQIRHQGRALVTRSVHKDGSRLYVELAFGLVKDMAGAVTGSFAIARNCTERYLSERALRARISELEAKTASGEAS